VNFVNKIFSGLVYRYKISWQFTSSKNHVGNSLIDTDTRKSFLKKLS